MNFRIIRKTLLILVILKLLGCSHIIANQIEAQKNSVVNTDIAQFVDNSRICSDNNTCINVQKINESWADNIKLEFILKINEKKRAWNFEAKSDAKTKTEEHLIFIFPGYRQPKQILAIHQLWLSFLTGAEVIVIDSADKAKQFKFGLNFIEPVLSEISRRKPLKVDLIGFSMGAIAAQHIALKVENSRLHLIAPMTDFRHSTLALWDILYKDSIYSLIISETDVESAVDIIYENSGVTANQIDLIKNLANKQLKTYVYSSTTDRVTLGSDWDGVNTNFMEVNSYQNLNHLEVIALQDESLIRQFISNLLEIELIENKVSTTGILCIYQDNTCTKNSVQKYNEP